MKSTRNRIAAVAATGALALGATLPAIAQEADEPTTQEQEATTEDEALDREARRAAMEAEFAERLAAELGLDEGTVADAVATVREELKAERRAEMLARLEERLATAVEEGRMTQEEADEVLARAEAGELPGRRGHRGPRGGHGPRADSDAAPAGEAA